MSALPTINPEKTMSEAQRMNPEIKARWVSALRSGEYKQSDQRALNDGEGGFCCLGVLCDLYAKDTGTPWQWCGGSDAMRLQGHGSTYYPSPEVRVWAEFHEDAQPIAIGGVVASAAVHNDGVGAERRTFAEIAAAIEEQL